MTQPPVWPAGVPVLIPVYNHGRTIAEVIRGCRAAGAGRILVVDDGSTDGSGAAAQAAGADAVLALAPNRGKGHALAIGLAQLARDGWRQALTIDADLQHPPAEAARLAVAAIAAPAALWLGVRDMATAPTVSRVGRWWTSLWTWVCCGCWPEDNQTGLRVYPLPAMTNLPIRAGRYAYEVESLIRAVWAGVAVRRVAVAVVYPADRVSHFDLRRDNLRTAWAFTRLVGRRLLPWPHVGADGRTAWGRAWTGGLEPRRAAAAAALGASLGVAPVPGAQTGLAVWLGLAFGLNLPVVLLASNCSFGPLLAAWFAVEVAIGHALRQGSLAGLDGLLAERGRAIAEQGPWSALAPVLTDWLIGALPVMTAAGLAAGTGAWCLARLAAGRRA